MSETQILFFIFLILLLGAVVLFGYFVIKPLQSRWAIRQGRLIAASGDMGSRWHFENVFRILATTTGDLEAAHLWHKLQEMKEQRQAAAEKE